MNYAAEFERDFISRTLALIDQYKMHVAPNVAADQQYETTLLINCLLGLLLLPNEHFTARILALPIEEATEWGIDESSVTKWGAVRSEIRRQRGVPREMLPRTPSTLSEFVHGLRNAAAHVHIKSIARDAQIDALQFRDSNGFEAVLAISSLKTFVAKLAREILADS